MVDGLAPTPHSPEESSISDHPYIILLETDGIFSEIKRECRKQRKTWTFLNAPKTRDSELSDIWHQHKN
ncbi:hypothetical protein AA14362_2641 [Acetobacter cerevisiae DSM 14362]|nr:hypothetical protein AA14362_2641 [Acetobacter cerevisiae DSM 14362]